MPISSSAAVDKTKLLRSRPRTRSVDLNDTSTDGQESHNTNFLRIAPAIHLDEKQKLYKRSNTFVNLGNGTKVTESSFLYDSIIVHSDQNGSTIIRRTQKQKEKDPDRITLDRRGFNNFPIIEGDSRLRLLSLQHNVISNLEHLKNQLFPYLVFLDLYDNQLERVCGLESIENIRVILMGKNRLRQIDGFQNLRQMEVLDLHGNKISQIGGLSNLRKLKVLNLAGNQIRIIGTVDLDGLISLQELNLRRNRLKKLLGFAETPNLIKLFLSNNDIKSIGDMSSVAKSTKIKEICIENNPISLGGDCISFLVSYLPQLSKLNSMQINDHVRKAAMAWRRNKESTNAAFMDLTSDVCLNGKRDEVISNARTNWELLRSQTRCTSTKSSGVPKMLKNLRPDSDFILTKLTKSDVNGKAKLRSRNFKVPVLPDKKIAVVRSSSQETENSQHTSSSNASSNEYIRLPPILVPIITKLEQESDNLKRCGSLSSLMGNADKSYSCDSDSESSCSSTESGDVIEEEDEYQMQPEFEIPESNLKEFVEAPQIVEKEPKSKPSTDSSSNISSSLSSVTLPSNVDAESVSLKSGRNIKSAHPSKASQALKLKARAATAKTKKTPTPPLINKDREQGGDYLIEICGRYLNIFGQGALRFIDKSWNASKSNDVTCVKFNYLNFNSIVGVLHKVKVRFPNAENFVFKETNIHSLGQINGLAETQGLSSLLIEAEGNPICLKNWRSYAVFRLSHWGLKYINDVEVLKEEIEAANIEYQSLSDLVLWLLPDFHLQPLLSRLRIDVKQPEHSAKKWLLSADPELKFVVSKEALQWKKGSISQEDLALRHRAKAHMSILLEETSNTVHKLRLLDHLWPSILQDLVCNTLLDYSHMDLYMKQKLQELMNT